MGGRRPIAVCCAVAATCGLASAAAADPNSDFAAVYSDWSSISGIPHCRYSKRQLVNARTLVTTVPEFQTYAPTFGADVNREIAYGDRGGCRGVARPPSKRRLAKSALRRVRIGKIRPRGRESVVIVNGGRKAVSLTGATLRDRSGHKVRLSGRLGARASKRVFSRGVWDNRGDVVKLADRKRLVVRQTGYGSWRGAVRF